jgi:Ca-activated chloride channel family protein
VNNQGTFSYLRTSQDQPLEVAMFRRLSSVLLFVLIALLSLASVAQADGIIVPEPPCENYDCTPWKLPVCPKGMPCPPNPPRPRPISQLEIKYHHVTVMIEQQVAVTHIDQVFYNPNQWSVEGTYIFPLPVDAVVSRFVLWVDGKPVDGKVLDAKEARQYYEDTIRLQKDPALLEYIGRGALQARVFPIPSKGERRIEVEYSQALTAENGLVRYVYPLSTEKFSTAPLDSVSVKVEIRASQALRAIYSPSHPVSITHQDENNATVGWEANQIRPDKDFIVYYSIGDSEALHLLSYRDPADVQDPDGFFLLLLAPRPELPDRVIAKDLIFVLDHSGSMEGEKFTQAQAALKYILQHLNSGDRFGLVAFSTAIEPYARGLRPADEANEAEAWVGQLSARGSTDINRALLEAVSMVDKERPTYIIFLTDGLPTIGEVKRERILENFSAVAPDNVRLFSFGVGNDVDTFLLDTLSEQHHGLSTYVRPGENLDEILSTFYERISTPVLTDLTVDFGGMNVYDLYPNPLPDLFAGSQVIVVGRYGGGGTVDLTLHGTVNDQNQVFPFAGQVFATDSRGAANDLSSLPRLWATRKIGYLLNQVRLKGADQETIDQIVKLSIRYGIVTPYTSYLVTEPMPLGAENQQRVAEDAYKEALSAPQAASGAGAVQRAADQGALSQAQQAPVLSEEAGQTLATVGSRTFVLSQGIWMDTAYDPQKMQTQKVVFLSDEYFRLGEGRPEVSAAMALGEKVIVLVDGKAYEIVEAGVPGPTPVMPETLTPIAVTPVLRVTPKPGDPTPLATDTLTPSVLSNSADWLPLVGIGLGAAVFAGLGFIFLAVSRKQKQG